MQHNKTSRTHKNNLICLLYHFQQPYSVHRFPTPPLLSSTMSPPDLPSVPFSVTARSSLGTITSAWIQSGLFCLHSEGPTHRTLPCHNNLSTQSDLIPRSRFGPGKISWYTSPVPFVRLSSSQPCCFPTILYCNLLCS